ncbi:DUF1203 domain-containing protein [Luteimonas sp. RD2P54]|uniref:DUF1203 domain-containing protein n=1 Tax=Luteimonas endophytica TaxID=3042023 RepID=A0ABT6JC55_9GAMM|nr:DUF1203 domain-containing protein [Luteimonas endophytica]MDH5823763.1 DUF1203 domain-containing protein [Luteimonas endophytica]
MSTDAPFRIVPLPAEPFAPLFALDDPELAARGARRMVADRQPGFPCRVSLVDAEVGEEVLLLPWEHHRSRSPYRASGPVFVRRGARPAAVAPGEIPAAMRARLFSLRAYDAAGDMSAAAIAGGHELETAIAGLFADPAVAFLHLHHAGRGCYACCVERVGPGDRTGASAAAPGPR